MQRFLTRLRAALRVSERLQAYLILSVVVPILLLAGFGLFAVVRDGYVWHALGISAAVCVAAGLPMLLRRNPPSAPAMAAPDPILFELRDAPDYWTPLDRQTCTHMLPELHAVLAQNPGWKTLPDHGLVLARRVALHYHQNHAQAQWAVTPIEVLAAAETLSRRYRRWLQEYVPGVERLHVAHWLWLDAQTSRLEPLVKLYGVYRKVRLLSPEGLLAELRSQFLDRMFAGVGDDVQLRLKTLLLRDAVYAAIDLYGGHYRHVDASLEESRAAASDARQRAAALEPVRICLIGQTGAGKSAILNALIGSLHAEVSLLPSTDRKTVYECTLAGEQLLRLVDLPGLTTQTARDLLVEATQSDLVLWALQADQPARALDVDFREQLRQWYARTPQRKPPVLLGVLTQVDKLAHPGAQDDPQALVEEALDYNRAFMALDDMLALSLVENAHPSPGGATRAFPNVFSGLFPVSRLQDALQRHYANALHVQLNRRRLESGAFSIRRESERVLQLGKALFTKT